MTTRSYQARVFKAGSTSLSTGNVEFTVGLAALADVPVLRGLRVRPLQGRVEAAPFDLTVQDSTASGFISHLADSGGRLTMVNRFVQVLRSDSGGAYSAIGGGRITDVVNAGNIAQWKLTVSQEWPTAAQTLIFTTNTTHLYPPCSDAGSGIGFYGFPVRYGYATLTRCDLSAVPSSQRFTHYQRFWRVVFRADNPPMNQRGWDAVARDSAVQNDLGYYGQSTNGAFRHLRFRANGTDYKVASFGTDYRFVNPNIHPFPSPYPLADDQTIQDHIVRHGALSFWITASSTAFGGTGSANLVYDTDNPFLHMMGAPASEETPLHIWAKSTSIPGGIHPMQVLKNILDGAYSSSTVAHLLPLYSTAAFTGAADLRKLPLGLVGFRITAPAPMQEWVQENLCAPYGVLATQDVTGAVRFKNFRLPVDSTTSTGFSTGSCYLFTSTNLRAPHPEWRANRAEACTVLNVQFQNYGLSADNYGTVPGADGADNIRAWPMSTSLYHDRRQQMGDFPVTLKYLGRSVRTSRLVPTAVDLGSIGDLTQVLARNVFTRFGDGPVQGTVHALENAATVAPGDLVGVKLATYPNLASNARGGTRLVQVLSKTVLADGYDFDYLDVGPMSAASTRPSLTLAVATDAPKTFLKYTVGNVPSSGGFVVDLAPTSGSAPAQTSTRWHPIGAQKGSGTFYTPPLPSGTYFWARARVQQPGKVDSRYAVSSAAVATSAIAPPTGLKTSSLKANQATSTWALGDIKYAIAVHVDTSTGATPSTANLYAKLGVGTERVLLTGLTSTHKHKVMVRHFDAYGGYSQTASSIFTTPAATAGPNIILPPLAGMFTIVGST